MGDRPVIDHIVEEVKNSGAREVVFVISPEKKILRDYFKSNLKIERILKERGKLDLWRELKAGEKKWQKVSFSFVLQKKPLGDGRAIFQARSRVGRNPVMVSFGDDLVISKTPCLRQLAQIFQKYGKPVLALKRVPKEKVGLYGAVAVQKVGPRLYQIRQIVEKPKRSQAPSNLVVVGKYILTPEVFDYLGRAQPSFRGEIILAETFKKMIEDGKMIYGYEFEGRWLECGSIPNWLKSNLFLAKKLNLL